MKSLWKRGFFCVVEGGGSPVSSTTQQPKRLKFNSFHGFTFAVCQILLADRDRKKKCRYVSIMGESPN